MLVEISLLSLIVAFIFVELDCCVTQTEPYDALCRVRFNVQGRIAVNRGEIWNKGKMMRT